MKLCRPLIAFASILVHSAYASEETPPGLQKQYAAEPSPGRFLQSEAQPYSDNGDQGNGIYPLSLDDIKYSLFEDPDIQIQSDQFKSS